MSVLELGDMQKAGKFLKDAVRRVVYFIIFFTRIKGHSSNINCEANIHLATLFVHIYFKYTGMPMLDFIIITGINDNKMYNGQSSVVQTKHIHHIIIFLCLPLTITYTSALFVSSL